MPTGVQSSCEVTARASAMSALRLKCYKKRFPLPTLFHQPLRAALQGTIAMAETLGPQLPLWGPPTPMGANAPAYPASPRHDDAAERQPKLRLAYGNPCFNRACRYPSTPLGSECVRFVGRRGWLRLLLCRIYAVRRCCLVTLSI
jgi:hypothetical protein